MSDLTNHAAGFLIAHAAEIEALRAAAEAWIDARPELLVQAVRR